MATTEIRTTRAATMTDRERILAILDRQRPDRIPWAPRLQIWHTARVTTGTLPAEYRELSLRELERAMGVGTPARDGRIYRIERPGVETLVHRDGNGSVLEYRTPYGSVSQRRVLTSYSRTFLDQMINVVTASTLLSYALYTMAPETEAKFGGRGFVYTIPFALFGIFRYLYLTYQVEDARNPTETMLRDVPFLANLALWGAAVAVIVYG